MDVPFVSLLYPTGATSSRGQERRIVLCQPVHSVGKSLHPQHGSLRAWGLPHLVGWEVGWVGGERACVYVGHCTLLLFAYFCHTQFPLPPPSLRSQTVCHAVQKVCESECSRQGAGNAGGGGAIL